MQLLEVYIRLLAYRVNLRHYLFIHEASEVHSSRHTRDGACSAALADRFVYDRYAANFCCAVGHSEFLVLICDCAVRTYLFAGRTAVTHHFVGMSDARVAYEFILAEKSDDFRCGGACLGISFGP